MTLKLRTKVVFPASVSGDNGITVTKKNGIWTIGQTISAVVSAVKDSIGLAGTSTDNAVVRFNGTSGGTQDSGVTIDDSGIVSGAKIKSTGSTSARNIEDRFSDVFNVKDYGAKGDGSTDDSDAINATIVAAAAAGSTHGSLVWFPAGIYNITKTLNVNANGVRLEGAGRYTVLKFSNGSSDCISIDGTTLTESYYCQVKNMHISHSGKTGGATIKLKNTNIAKIEGVGIDQCWNSIDTDGVNNIMVRDVVITQVNGAFGVRFFGTATTRSDVLTLDNVSINCNYKGGDAIVWDGNANTFRIIGVNALSCRRGLWVLNSAGSTTLFPTFLEAFDLECDGCSDQAVRIESGQSFYFDTCNISNTSGAPGQGGADNEAFYIAADLTKSITRKIAIANTFIGNSQKSAAFIDASEVAIASCLMADASKAGSGLYPVVTIGGNTQGLSIASSRVGPMRGQTARESYGVVVNSGATKVRLVNNDYSGCVTGEVLNSSTTGSVVRFDGLDKSGNPLVGVKSYIDGNLERRVDNSAATAAAQARDVMSTGTANSYWLRALLDQGGTPIAVESLGPGVTALYQDADLRVFRTRGGTEIGRLTSSGLSLSAAPLAAVYGGTAQTTYVLGDILYSSAANALSRLAGNTAATRKFLRQTGTGTVSAAPAWDTIVAADIPASALTKVDDTNVTLALGGSAASALLAPASLTLGWTGQLAVSRGGTGGSTAQAACANLKAPYILAQSAVQSSHTGDTAETVLATITIPANALGPNGAIEIDALFSVTNSANNKTLRVRFGGISGTIMGSSIATTSSEWRVSASAQNRNATNSQVMTGPGLFGGWHTSGSAVSTSAVDTTAAVDVVITGTLANTSETISLEWYRARILVP